MKYPNDHPFSDRYRGRVAEQFLADHNAKKRHPPPTGTNYSVKPQVAKNQPFRRMK